MRDRTGPLRRIVDLQRRYPDEKHDARTLECGHVSIVPKQTLHPLTARCGKCKDAK